MTQASFPFEGIDTTETQFSKWARHFNSGVDDVPTGDGLEVSAGTGLAIDVEPGEAMVRGHYYTSDATESLSLATADATNDRIDTVVLRLDPTANSIILAVKTGTPDAAPTAPALVETDAGIFEQALANVLVPANSGVPTTITDRREFMGTRLGSWTTAGRPTPAGRVLFGFNTTDEAVEFYDPINDVWGPVAPAIDELNDIGDVTITTPTDGDVLAYDDGTSEWVNQALTPVPAAVGSNVVSVTKLDTFTTTSTSFVDLTGMSVTITPSSATSKILILVSLSVGTNEGIVTSQINLMRASTNIFQGTPTGSRIGATLDSGVGSSSQQPNSIIFLDSPASASAQTYKLQIRSNNGSSTFINRRVTDTDSASVARTPSSITVIEVAA